MGMFWKKALVRTVGRLSRGVALCYSDGPTAGRTLSHAYRNVPEGKWVVGRWIDRYFLKYEGWEKARGRLAGVAGALVESAAALRREGMPVDMVDIASGAADYVEKVFAREEAFTLVCRDLCEKSLGAARERLGSWPQVRFERADALDGPGMQKIVPRPTLVLSSGLHELLDDEAVEKSMGIVARVLVAGGRFVMAHQVGHADAHTGEKLFGNAEGRQVRLYLRSAEMLAEMLRGAGFEVLESAGCAEGWYTVIIARKGADGPGTV